MAIIIEDARGRGYKASVSTVNRLNVSGKNADRSFYINRDNALSFNWTSTYSATNGDEIIYIKNTNKSADLNIENITLSAEAGRATFTLYEVSGTASGTSITGKNMNLKSGNIADVTSLGDAAVTGITLGDKIDIISGIDDATSRVVLPSKLILGFNNAIAISFAGSNGTVSAVVHGFFEGDT